jgi:hypothetical protein
MIPMENFSLLNLSLPLHANGNKQWITSVKFNEELYTSDQVVAVMQLVLIA